MNAPTPKPPWRNLRRLWYRLTTPRAVPLDGIRVCTDRRRLSRSLRHSLYRGTYEYPERLLMRGVLRPSDRVLDLGACIGILSLVAARTVGEERVRCYEANPALEPLIRENFRLNNLFPDLRMKALTVDGAEVPFFQSPNPLSSSLFNPGPDSREIRVPSDPIAEVVAEYRPDVLLMDIEGAEVDLLPATDLTGVRHLVLEVHDHIVGAKKIRELLEHLKSRGLESRRVIRKSYLLQNTT